MPNTRIIIGKVRLSYCSLWEPTAMDENSEKKYSSSIIIPKTDSETIAKINEAIVAETEEGKHKHWKGKVPANLRHPLRDGDLERPDNPEYADSYFITVSTKHKPPLYNKDKIEITDPYEVKSGDYALIDIHPYSYSFSGNNGIAFALNAVLKLHDGTPLGGDGKGRKGHFDDVDISVYSKITDEQKKRFYIIGEANGYQKEKLDEDYKKLTPENYERVVNHMKVKKGEL